MIANYLEILENSLKKKDSLLDAILAESKKQNKMLSLEELNLEEFDKCVDQKDLAIDEISKLDEGFDALYEKIKKELLEDKAAYSEQIRSIQDLISKITEKNVAIQALEERNRDILTRHFSKERAKIGQGRKNSKAALGYYRNLNKAIQEGQSAMDYKK